MAISPGIFRQYDVRGIIGKDLTSEAARGIGTAYAAYMAEQDVRGAIAVGRDNRPSGAALRDALVDGLTSSGVDVIDIGIVPTPLTYWALHHLPVVGGIQITGSHNPPEYNGFKLSIGTGSLHGDEIQHLYELTQKTHSPAAVKGSRRDEAVIDRYIDDVVQRTGKLARPIHAVYDCGNGAGALVAPKLFERASPISFAQSFFCFGTPLVYYLSWGESKVQITEIHITK
jgi:phosphomannomutase/phosphoglucomutase